MRTIPVNWRLVLAWASRLLILGAFALSGCGGKVPATSSPASDFTPTATEPAPGETPTETALPTPTPTPEPAAAFVNREAITLAEFQAELERYRQAQQAEPGTNLATQDTTQEMIVIQALIDQVLLAQGALRAGYTLDETTFQARYDALAAQTDLSQWLPAHGFTEDSFRRSLRRSIEAAWMRDQVLQEMPAVAEQVHARQILLYNSEDANQVYASLQSGVNFDDLASLYDPIGKGDLGWFPRGYLMEPAIEEAAFSLEPGEISAVIETRLGFHLLKVIERDPERALEPDPLKSLQAQALQRWLDENKTQSEIQVLVP